MTTEKMIVDVSRGWVLACDVQQGFMQAPCADSDSLDYSARSHQVRALGGDCYSFILLKSDQLALCLEMHRALARAGDLTTVGCRITHPGEDVWAYVSHAIFGALRAWLKT